MMIKKPHVMVLYKCMFFNNFVFKIFLYNRIFPYRLNDYSLIKGRKKERKEERKKESKQITREKRSRVLFIAVIIICAMVIIFQPAT